MEQRQLLTAVVAPADARIDGTTGAITAPVPANPGHTFFVDGGTTPQWNMASAITPNTTNDLILNALPTDTNYTACCEAGGGSPGNVAVFTDGTMGSGPSDPSATTNVIADLTLPWHATYSLGSNPNGYDITEIDSITGHQDYRTQQHIDIEVEFAGTTNFVSLSGGNGFSFTADATGALRKGSAQMAIVNSANPGTAAIVRNVAAIRFDDLPGDPAFFRELVVTGTASTTTITGSPAAPTGLTATFNGLNATNLSFTNNANNAQGFLIQRSNAAGGPFTTIGTIASASNPGDVINFTDPNISGNSTYFYQVVAFNSNGQAASNVAGPVVIPNIGAEAHYYNTAFWAGTPAVSTSVLSVNYNSGGGSPDPAIRASNNSTVFTGKVHTDAAGTYTFISNTDDDGYLYVNGQLVSEDPGGHGTRNATSLVPISLAANTAYDFVLLQDQGGGGAGANLLWVEPGGMNPVLVPSDHLTPTMDTPQTPTGLAVDPFSSGLSPNPNPHGVDFVFDSNNNAVVKYLLQRRPGTSTSDSDWTTVNSTDPQGTLQDFNNPGEFTIKVEDASAIPGTSYQYRVLGMNFDANSAPSNTVNVSTPALPAQAPGVEARFFNGELIASPQDPRNIMVIGTPSEFVPDSFGVVVGSGAPISGNFGNSSPDPTLYPDIPRIHVDDFATLFTGKIRTDAAGTYTFITNSDDDAYMWVNGQLVSADPGGHGTQTANEIAPISLAANTEYDFVVMQQERGGGAAVTASWIEPDGMGGSTALIAIPNDTPGGAGGFEMNMDAPNKQTINASGAVVTDNTQSAAGQAYLQSTGATGNVISWTDQSTSEVWFQVERSTDGTNFSVIGKSGFNTTSFTDSTAVSGTHYFYRVRGMNFDAQGTASNVVDTANVTLPVPALTATSCVPNQVELTFNGQSTFSGGFEIQYHDNTSSTFVDVPGAAALPATATSFAVAGLDPTKTYTFQIRNLAGTGSIAASAFSAAATSGATGAPVLDHSSGFTTAPDIYANGNAKLTTVGTGTALQLTAPAANQDGTAYDTNMQGVDAFNTTFDFQFNQGGSNPQADGFTFIIQNGPIFARGGGGGALGYNGGSMPTTSVAVKFDLWNGGPMDSTTGVYTGAEAVNDTLGATPGLLHVGYSMEASGIKFHDNFADTFRANLKYDGTTLTETVTDLTTNAVFTMAYAINIPQIVGSNCAFVGFGGGTGGAFAEQDILNWKFTSLAAANHPPHLPADFNGDGQQNFSDLLILAQNYGGTGKTFSQGDANGDGTVNFADLLILAQNYGKTSAAAPAAAASGSSLDLLASARKAKPLARKR